MRLIFAIIALVIATALIGVGVAQRTFLLPPDRVTSETASATDEPYTLLDSKTLTAHPGKQSLSLTGEGDVFFAYGREADVAAWLNGSSYNRLSVDKKTGELVEKTVEADPEGAENVASGSANPEGSDLWFEEYQGKDVLDRTVNLPAGYSIIISSDGKAAAPSGVSISWPLNSSTPWAVPLLLSGAAVLLIGLALLIWGLIDLRRSQGPRRKPPTSATGKRFSSSRTNAIESGVKRQRRGITRAMGAIIPATLTGALLFGGALQASAVTPLTPTDPTATPTSTSTPSPSGTPSTDAPSTDTPSTDTPSTDVPASDAPTPAPTGAAADTVPPAVTEQQLDTILGRISKVATDSDAAGNKDMLGARFEGPALQARQAVYAIRATGFDYPAPAAIPATGAKIVLPQATKEWPKTVFTVVENDDKTIAPQALTLVQETPRAPYKVQYAIALQPDTTLPPVAATTVGTARLAPDTKLLEMTPEALVKNYADILAVGSASKAFNLIDTSGDSLLPAVGADYKAAQKAGLAASATMDFAKVDGIADPIALATDDSGALVSFNLRESQTVTPVIAGATVEPKGATAALLGLSSTPKGTQAVFDYQLLFYIPPAGDPNKPKLLGFTQGLVQAKELP